MQYFYHQHIDYDGFLNELRFDKLDSLEKEELETLINQIVHKKIIEIILELLPRAKHEQWLFKLMTDAENKDHWDFLKSAIKEDIQYEVKHQFAKLKKELLEEVKRTHKK